MFALCVLYSKGQKTKPAQSGQRSRDKVQRKINPLDKNITNILRTYERYLFEAAPSYNKIQYIENL
jgi:hypothetical protein